MNIRAIRLELIKPLNESWAEAGPLLRLLANATPKLTNAAYDALVACRLVGAAAVKEKIAPDTKGGSPEALAYQETKRAVERLRDWGSKAKPTDGARSAYAALEVPGGMVSSIVAVASQAYARRDQGRITFSSERILARAVESKLTQDDLGTVLEIKLRPTGRVRFACAHSRGGHRETLSKIVSGEYRRGDVKLQRDPERKKWYALISYEQPEAAPLSVDPARVLVVHRGVRNALYPILSSAEHVSPLRGGKFVAQRRKLQARMRDCQRINEGELGVGAKSHGRARRMERYSVLDDKLSSVTKTFCQQAAAWVGKLARDKGCGLVVIEDYGGIGPAPTRELRRVLERFPLYQLKEAIASRLVYVRGRRRSDEPVQIALKEVSSLYISTTCPRCKTIDPKNHNTRTNTFHCTHCSYSRDADWIAAFWMLTQSGVDMSYWERKLEMERRFAESAKEKRHEAEG